MEKHSIGWYKPAEAMKPLPSSSDVRNADEHGESIHEITMIRGMRTPLDPLLRLTALPPSLDVRFVFADYKPEEAIPHVPPEKPIRMPALETQWISLIKSSGHRMRRCR